MSEAHHFHHSQDPFVALDREVEIAKQAGLSEPNAMTLSTITKDGRPRSRIVLYKGQSKNGLSFFTNYDSDKAQELENRDVALLFHWNSLETQVRVEGIVEKMSREESEAYFRTRARLSQIGAWSSKQSQEIPNFKWLEDRVKEFEDQFAGKEIPCPPNWGGYRVLPTYFEFWFGRRGRLHERFCYERQDPKDPNWRRFLRSP